MKDFRLLIKMMVMALVMGALFCSCNAAGGSDSYEAVTQKESQHNTTAANNNNNGASAHNVNTNTSAENVNKNIFDSQDFTTGAKAVLSGTHLTFYYDNKDHSAEGTVYKVNSNGYNGKGAPWKNSGFKTASFDSSCQDWAPTSMAYFFTGCADMESVDCTNLNTAYVYNMNGMFQQCYSLKNLDLSTFDMGYTTYMNNMFFACFSMESVVVPADFFETISLTDSHGVFGDCPAQIING